MKRMTFLAALALLVLTAMPAAAQYGGGEPQRPPVAPGQIEITTPCSTIVITGDSWAPGTEIFIDRENCGRGPNVRADVPEEADEPNDDGDFSSADSAPGSTTAASGSTTAASGGTAAADPVIVADDGTFLATVQVPAGAVEEYAVEVRGTGLDGEAKSQVYTVDVVQAASFVPTATDGDSAVTIAVVALFSAVILAVGFIGPRLAWRRRR